MRSTRLAAISAAALALAACSQQPGDGQAAVAAGESTPGTDAVVNDMTPTSVDVVEAASANGNLDTFLQAAIDAGIGERLAQAQQITIFAPIDPAFNAIPDLQALRQDPARLAALLERHAVPSTLLATNIPAGETRVRTLSGETLTITNTDGQISVTSPGGSRAMVVQANIEGDNGVVHAIDTVLAR